MDEGGGMDGWGRSSHQLIQWKHPLPLKKGQLCDQASNEPLVYRTHPLTKATSNIIVVKTCSPNVSVIHIN